MKFLYIGVDALDWEEFNTPLFADLLESGTFGKCIPEIDHTVPSWTSINTGLTVNQHRVMPFSYYPSRYGEKFNLQFTDDQCMPISTAHMVYKYIWDYLYDAAWSINVVNFPVTYPPRRWEWGTFVSGYPATSQQDFFLPEHTKIPWGYLVDWTEIKPMYEMSTLDICLNKMKEIESDKIKVALNVPQDWDSVCVQFPIIDRIGHEFDSKGYSRAHELEAITYVYRTIKYLVSALDPEYLLIVSDHGMKRGLHTFNGIWYFRGPGVKEFHRQDTHNYEILPIVLDTLKVPYWQVIYEEPEVRELTEKDYKIINEQLRRLGYL